LERSERGPCRTFVVGARLRFSGKGSATFAVDVGGKVRYTVLLTDREFSASVVGVEARTVLRTVEGEIEVWFTNADGFFRVETDGEECVRKASPEEVRGPRLALTADGAVEVLALDVARDLVFGGSHRARVPEGQYYVLGDNAPRSRDSRVFGPIPGDSIFGRVAAVAWPTERIRVVR
jgi:hypothetical protein